MLAVFAYWGTQTGSGFLVQLLLGVGVPIVAVVIWGIFLAPKSTRRFTGIPYVLLKLIIFGLSALALVAAGQQTLAIIFAVVVLVNVGLGYVWKQG
jgi:hypothetical protein